MNKSISNEEILQIGSFDVMANWIEEHEIFHSSVLDYVKKQIDKPITEGELSQFDLNQYHDLTIPEDPEVSFTLGFYFGVVFAAISSIFVKRGDTLSERENMILKHLVYLGVLTKYHNESQV